MATLSLKKKPTPAESVIPAPAPLSDGHFFFLWRLDAKRPTQRHASLEAATVERNRLGKENPGKTFLIFEAKRIFASA